MGLTRKNRKDSYTLAYNVETSPNKVDAYLNEEVGEKWLRYLAKRGS